MNILIDNILADYGITLKAKTVVLDSTKSLSLAEVPALAKSQCSTCARNGVTCFKNITTYMCDEWLGTKTLCKAEPVVLTEEFAGASKEKVINELIKSHGYDPIAAEVKHNAFDNRLLMSVLNPTTIRMVPPLIVNKEQIDEAFSILEKCI